MTTSYVDFATASSPNSASVSAPLLYQSFLKYGGERPAPATRQAEKPEQRFERLREEWQADTMLTSSVTAMIAHPAYLGIIGMGESAVPLLLEDFLKNEPDQWAPALAAITGADPVPPEAWGDMQAIADAWIRWGRVHGYLR